MTSVEQALVQAVRGPFLDWLAGYDFVPGRFDAFMAGACQRLVAMGIPIWRAALGL
ncbi:MAG: hypothetical protein U1E17_25765 [Geminicoccaceae bacterium]